MRTAVIAVDVQLDYLPGGAMGSEGSDQAAVSLLRLEPAIWIASRRLYQKDTYISFADDPPHCIKGTKGARLYRPIEARAEYVITKDGLSAFEGGTLRPIQTLEQILAHHEIKDVIIGGYFYEEAVAQTAFDANALGYETTVDVSGSCMRDLGAARLLHEKFARAGIKFDREKEAWQTA